MSQSHGSNSMYLGMSTWSRQLAYVYVYLCDVVDVLTVLISEISFTISVMLQIIIIIHFSPLKI